MGSPAWMRSRGSVALALGLALLLVVGLATSGNAGKGAVLPGKHRISILPLGDSITQGVSTGFPGGETPGGYRSPLDSLLTDEQIAHTFVGTSTVNPSPTLTVRNEVHHEGHPGYRVGQVTADLDGVAGGASDNGGYWITGNADHPRVYPAVVVIHLGTNDISQRYDPGASYPGGLVNYSDPAQRGRFVSDLAKRLKALVDKLFTLRPNTRVVLSDIVPMEANNYLPVSSDYAKRISGIVDQERALGRSIVFADVFRHFVHNVGGKLVADPGLMTSDGIHPAPAGYAVMARVYAVAIKQALQG